MTPTPHPYVERYEGEPGMEKPPRPPRDLPDSHISAIIDGILGAYTEGVVTHMSRKEYRESYLKSERWAAVRERLFQARAPRCEDCREVQGRRHLDVHHLTYERLGNEEDADLLIVCRACHDKRHRKSP